MPEQVAYCIKEKTTKELLLYTMKGSRKICTEDFFEGTTESFKEKFECVKVSIKF